MDIPIISPIFGFIIKGVYNLVGQNYFVTLFLFAIIIKIILLPFGIKQQKNSIKQSKLRPKEMAIRNKYKGRNDKATQQKMSEEIMKLYQEENVNPMSGCLPMLIQLPVLFALYGVIIKPLTYISSIGKSGITAINNAIETVNVGLKAAGEAVIKMKSAGEIPLMREILTSDHAQALQDALISQDASWTEKIAEMADINKSFTLFGVDLTANASLTIWPLLLIPILTFIFSFLSTKIIRKFTYQPQMGANADPAQKASMGMMDWMMPLLSVWISLSIPAAIAVYWIFQNILSALQQILLYKLYPVPAITEEMIKEAELQLKGKSKKTKQVVLSDDEIDDYDKTVEKDKSGSAKKSGVMSSRKGRISPKVKAMYVSGTRLKARKKI